MLPLDEARAAYTEACATAAEAIDAIIAPARAKYDKAMRQARAVKGTLTRRELADWLSAWQQATEVAQAIRSGPEADVTEALQAARGGEPG